MANYLVIVESPAKVKTIKKFLGPQYMVQASVGHVRDLPAKALGVNEEDNFAPQYEVIDNKKNVVSELRAAAQLILQDVIDDFVPQIEAELRRRGTRQGSAI